MQGNNDLEVRVDITQREGDRVLSRLKMQLEYPGMDNAMANALNIALTQGTVSGLVGAVQPFAEDKAAR